MNKRQKLEQIFELLARIPVAGDAVDIMAAVRSELRTLHRQIRAEDTALANKNSAEQKTMEEKSSDLNGTDKEDSDV